MYQNLIEEWAKAEGFQTFCEDHAAVLRNLTRWLECRSNEVANTDFNLTQPSESQVKS